MKDLAWHEFILHAPFEATNDTMDGAIDLLSHPAFADPTLPKRLQFEWPEFVDAQPAEHFTQGNEGPPDRLMLAGSVAAAVVPLGEVQIAVDQFRDPKV